MDLDQVLNRVQGTPIAVAIREHEILFPWIESFHVLAIVLVVGTISIVDLRLLGLASRNRAVTALMREVLPYTWAALLVALITGSLLFSSNATKYAPNFYFEAKMALLAIAACNMAAFPAIGGGANVCGDPAEKTARRRQATGGMTLLHVDGVEVTDRRVRRHLPAVRA